MTARAPVRVVFNYLVFIKSLTSEADDFSEAYEAYQVLRRARHLFMLTERIQRAYANAAKGRVTLEPLLLRVSNECLTSKKSSGGRPSRVPGLGKWHEDIVFGAILAGANYLITNHQPWLDLAAGLLQEFNLQVLRPGDYIRRFSP